MTTIPRVYIGPQPRVRIDGIAVARGVPTDLPADIDSALLVDADLWAALEAVSGLAPAARARAARLLAGRDIGDVDDDELVALDGVGPKTAEAIRRHVTDPPPPAGEVDDVDDGDTSNDTDDVGEES